MNYIENITVGRVGKGPRLLWSELSGNLKDFFISC